MLRWSVAALLFVVATGCGSARTSAQTSDLVIYDWEAQRASAAARAAHDLRCRPQACPDPSEKTVYVVGPPRLGAANVDRKSVRPDVDSSTGAATVILSFTRKGQTRFEELTRSLAHRGARVGAPQHVLIVVDDVVYASPFIDFRRSGVTSADDARRLAKRLRGES